MSQHFGLIAALSMLPFSAFADNGAPAGETTTTDAKPVEAAKAPLVQTEATNFVEKVQKSVASYLDSQNWKYVWDEDRQVFLLVFSLEGVGDLREVIQLYPEADNSQIRISSRAYANFNVPADKRGEIAKLLLARNFSTILSGYQMDMNDGEVLFETTFFCYNEQIPSADIFDRFINVPVIEIQKMHGAMMKIIHAGATAETAYKELM